MPIPKRATKWSSQSKKKSSEDTARGLALRLIKYRPRSSWEVVQRLKRAKFDPVEIDSTVNQLTQLKLLDDARFARDWVCWRDRLRPSGRRLLKQELKEKGLTAELIERTLDERETPAWFEEIGLVFDGEKIDRRLAADLTAKFARQSVKLPLLKKKTRLANLLARRGFSGEIVYAQIRLLTEMPRPG